MNHTTLGIAAIVAAAALLVTALGTTNALAWGGHHHKSYFSQNAKSAIVQENEQDATCIQPATVNIVPISCNEIGLNLNTGNPVAANTK
jgi:hypothetical protein